MNKGFLLVISGPSGSGKGTVVSSLLGMDDRFTVSVSATTRAPREGEVHGKHYYFIDRAEFERRIGSDMMLEWAEYCGNYYGTPGREVSENLEAGKNVILEIEVAGAMQIKKKCPGALLIMIAPPDFKTLEARLRGRGDNVDESVIAGRLATAKKELARLAEYDYIVVNHDGAADQAAADIIGIVDAEQHRVERSADFADKFFAE